MLPEDLIECAYSDLVTAESLYLAAEQLGPNEADEVFDEADDLVADAFFAIKQAYFQLFDLDDERAIKIEALLTMQTVEHGLVLIDWLDRYLDEQTDD